MIKKNENFALNDQEKLKLYDVSSRKIKLYDQEKYNFASNDQEKL